MLVISIGVQKHELFDGFDDLGNKLDNATLWCKESGVFAGKPFVDRIFSRLHCTVTWNVAEGDWIDASKGKVAVRNFYSHFQPSINF